MDTRSAAPTVAPRHVGGGDGKVGELTMTWEPLTRAQQGAPNIGYRLYWRKNTGRPNALWNMHKIDGHADYYVAFVGPDNYYLEYDFKLQAFNDRGYGPNSSEVIIMSAEDCM
ncbi:contactin [Plakobranchus ocellatus]|uniref:Contactin n=1 Tax=Plakobranchus ocellatus TaxID=259542 RepID=A0AAV3ZG25_9GAST|nr:contactin [Plakobranchus ocellatus]